MTLVTLHGMIPVYVQVDTEDPAVRYVCASDEEFIYVGERQEHVVDHRPQFVSQMRATFSDELPLAYDVNGDKITDEALIARAKAIAEGDPEVVGDQLIDWPGWSWGW